MTRKSILAWTLVWTLALAALLLVAWAVLAQAGPREPAPLAPGLSPTEQYCRGLGLFAYRRSTERERGYSLTDVLSMTRRFAVQNNLDATTRDWQEGIVLAIFHGGKATPALHRQAAEDACMEWAREIQATPRTTTPDAKLRY
jgi:hypothetical protein